VTFSTSRAPAASEVVTAIPHPTPQYEQTVRDSGMLR
jgi:hypothetical protein